MDMKSSEAYGYYFSETGKPLEKRAFVVKDPGIDEAVVAVAGCGLCHTDLVFISGNVKTKAPPPLILGHEISGKVVAAGSRYERLVGTNVIIPAVLPCGCCELCVTGRSNICRNQKMPGNDFHGGFASHVTAPGRFLCPLSGAGDNAVAQLSVIADAVATPYQSLLRSGLRHGDLAIVIGAGGIGIYMVQLAARVGATVIAVDIEDANVQRAIRFGARFGINAKGLEEKDIKGKIRTIVKEQVLPEHGWKVFETSGTAGGQKTAFHLLSFAGTIAVVGFTMHTVEVRLSNLMAFDADMFGNWGCKPEHYPAVVDMILRKEINIVDTVEERPLDSINEVIALAMQHKLEKRVIFIP
jgi:6-hydroxycyclohex-1-ene-1-carbonyl-CoA dehydrogenase